jgi:GNAT superfamily N-acetyltransferase
VELKIRPIRDGKSRLGRAFFAFPFGLYRDTPQWVLPFARGIRRIIEQKHPFFAHSRGEAFVITEGDRVVARFLMLEPVKYNDYTGNHDVRLGLPEGIDRPDVWEAMFGHAREWGHARGARRLIGPQHFSPMDGSGILVDGFDHPASMTMMPYHHPWVAGHFEAAGFRKYKDFVSARAASEGFVVPDKIRRVAEISGRRSGMTVETLRGRGELRRLGREIGELYNRAWEDHAEFRPLTTAELAGLVDDLVTVATPELITVLRGPGGDLAGFVLPFPDLTPALQRSGGHLGLRTILDLRRERRRTTHCIVNGLGILPEYRNRGGTALLYTYLIDRMLAAGMRTAEMTQIAETTDLMLSDLETLGGEVYKRHRVYEVGL